MTRLANRRPASSGLLRAFLRSRVVDVTEAALEVAVEAGDPLGPLLASTLAEAAVPRWLMERVLKRCDGPRFRSTVRLREVALLANERVYTNRRRRWPTPDHQQGRTLARLGQNLSIRRRAAGRHQAAVRPVRRSVELARELVADGGPAERELLADCLQQLGAALSDTEDRHAALGATTEAVELFRALAAEDPSDARRETLARALLAASADLGRVERRDQALAAASEAVELCRQLRDERPDHYQSLLAKALLNQAVDHARLGCHDAALEETEEAVVLGRSLAYEQPDVHGPAFARALYNLGNRLADAGRLAEAEAATAEAVAVRRRLWAGRPEAFAPELARGLNTLGVRLDHLKRYEEAARVTEEATAMYRELYEKDPGTSGDPFALALANLGLRLTPLGRYREAIEAAEAAVALRRALYLGDPQVHGRELAASLTNLGGRYLVAERWRDALSPLEEAAQLLRPLARQKPDAFVPDAVAALLNLSAALGQLDRLDRALSVTREALNTLRWVEQPRPALEAQVAKALNHLGIGLDRCGRHQQAVEAFEASVARYRVLSESSEMPCSAELAKALTNLAALQLRLGSPATALVLQREALARHEEALAHHDLDVRIEMAGLHRDLGSTLNALDEVTEAVDENLRAERLLLRVEHLGVESRRRRLAKLLHNRAIYVRRLGRPADAVDAGRRALALFRLVARSRNASPGDRDSWAESHSLLGVMLQEAGELESAERHARRGAAMHRHQLAQRPSNGRQEKLAAALTNLAVVLSARDPEAYGDEIVACLEEVVRRNRSLWRLEPASFAVSLAAALRNLSDVLLQLGRLVEALAPAREAVATLGGRVERTETDTVRSRMLRRHRAHLATVLRTLRNTDRD